MDEPNPDLPTEQVAGKPVAIADAIVELLEEFYPVDKINGAQVFEMLDALAIVTANIIGLTGEHRPDFDQHFRAKLAAENLWAMGIDPDQDDETEHV